MGGLEKIDPGDQPGEELSIISAVDLRYIRARLELLRSLGTKGEFSESELRAHFFRQTIGEWQSGLRKGMDVMSEHLLYRLTDFVDPAERETTGVWPRSEHEPWATVEDWRREWEQKYPDRIPVFNASELEPLRLAITSSATDC